MTVSWTELAACTPPESGDYLVTAYGDHEAETVVTQAYYSSDTKTWLGPDEYTRVRVLAWSPMPPPWRG